MKAFLLSTVRYARLAFGSGQTPDHAERRDVRILQGIFSALAGRGVAAIVSFVSGPLTVKYLGAERYGAWIIIGTAIAWVALADLGLSSSVTNAVSEGYARGRQDLAHSYVAGAFWSLAGIAALLGAIFFCAWPRVPWDRVFNVR